MRNGYFNDKEFIVTNMRPRRPQYNYLWNDNMLCQCDHFGNGYAFRNIGIQRRDIDRGERNVFIKDKDTGLIYSANRNYNNLPFDLHETHVGLGYHTVVSEYNCLRVEFSILVAKDDPVLLFNIKVKNISSSKKNFDLYFANLPTPDISWHASYGCADINKELNGILYTHEGYNLSSEYSKIFVAANKQFKSFETNLNKFVGIYDGFHNPVALKEETLSSSGTTFDTYIAAFQFELSLEVGEEYEVSFATATEKTVEDCVETANKYLKETTFDNEKQKQIELNNSYIDVYKVNTPDTYLNNQVNIWLKRQLSLGKTWGRIYGKGFRDVMQDITAFVSFDNDLAKQKIINALKHQYEDGNPIRMFEPDFKYPYNDGGIWIPATVLAYINESGDLDILNIDIPYLKGDSYENSSLSDAYSNDEYVAGERKANVLDHVQAAMDYLLGCRGQHNLVLWRGGDWNDSLNNVGNKGIGEGVWLSIATVKGLNDFIEILRIVGKDDLAKEYEIKRDELKEAINTYGKAGNYYIYGISDEQEIIGGSNMMFLNPQSWAVFGGLSTPEDLNKTMDEVEQKLKCDYGYVLCSPSFRVGKDSIGRVSYFQPGLVENGGVYNHGVAFKIIADCMLKRNDIAYNTLKLISCDNPRLVDSGVEPYAVTNMYIGPENPYLAGYAPMSWITGTAGWLYRATTEYICGVKATVNGLMIDPCLPSHWDNVTVTRNFRGATYKISIKRGKNKGLYVNGTKLISNIIPLANTNDTVICEAII